MAEPREGFGRPDEATSPAENLPSTTASSPSEAPAAASWPVYDGRPEAVSDGAPMPVPAAAPPRQPAWLWPIVGLVGAMVIGSELAGIPRPTPTAPEPRSPDAVAPGWWVPVSPELTAGAVVITGAAEADGIVLSSSGVVATSYSRITGERRPREFDLTILAADSDTDIALVDWGGVPSSVAKPGTPVQVGDTLSLLDAQGGRQPVLGIGVTVTATDQVCSRAGSDARPVGFAFSLDVATAEPGAALVRDDGTVVGMYYGGDDATHHCAIPIADVMEAMRADGLDD